MPSQISLMGDFQVEDSRSVVHSNTNHRKIVSLTKVSNRKAHCNRVFRKTKHKRSSDRYEPVDKLTKINMKKILNSNKLSQIKEENICNYIIHPTENYELEVMTTVRPRSNMLSSKPSNLKICERKIKTSQEIRRKSLQKNKFFKSKNINPKNYCFYENTSERTRTKANTQMNSDKPKHIIESYEDICSNDIVCIPREKSKESKYLIPKPEKNCKKFRYTMGKTELNRIKNGKPIINQKQCKQFSTISIQQAVSTPDFSSKWKHKKRRAQSSYLTRSVSTLTHMLSTRENELYRIIKVIEEEQKLTTVENLRDELEKIQKEENYKFFTARFSDHINLNQGIREIAKRPVQIMLGNVKSADKDQIDEVSRVVLLGNKPKIEGNDVDSYPRISDTEVCLSIKKHSAKNKGVYEENKLARSKTEKSLASIHSDTEDNHSPVQKKFTKKLTDNIAVNKTYD